MNISGEVLLTLPDISGSVSYYFYDPVKIMAVTPQYILVDLLSSDDGDSRLLKPDVGFGFDYGSQYQITVFGSDFLAEGNRTLLYCWFEVYDERDEDEEDTMTSDGSPNVMLELAEIWDDSSASCFLPPELKNLLNSIEPHGDDGEVGVAPAVHHVRVRLTQNLIDASSTWADLVIYENPPLSSIVPGVGMVGGGGTEVSIMVTSPLPPLSLSSSSDERGSSWYCSIGNALVKATLNESDSSVVMCTIPESFQEGSVLVTLEIGEAESWPLTTSLDMWANISHAAAISMTTSSSATLFTYVIEPQVAAISPPNGPLMGGTPLIVSGTGMQPIPGLTATCTFTFTSGEMIVVNASYVSPTSAHCISPTHPSVPKPNLFEEEMTASVAMSLNGGLQWSKSTVNYLYTIPVTITKAIVIPYPASDDTERRFQAIAYGSGFINSTELICLLNCVRFNLPIFYLSENSIACQLPIREERESAILGYLQVSNNNGLDNSNDMEFLIPPGINGEEISVSPMSGPPRGGTVISIYATPPSSSPSWLDHHINMMLYSENSAVVLCGFGNGETETFTMAHLLKKDNSSVLLLSCTTPPVHYTNSVSVTLGGYEVGIFTYKPDIHVISVLPDYVIVSEVDVTSAKENETTISILINASPLNYDNSSDGGMLCRFGEEIVGNVNIVSP